MSGKLLLILPMAICITGCKISGLRYPPPQDIERIDAKLIGITIHKAVSILGLDSTQYGAFDEPPLVIRGIIIDLGDTCTIHLYVKGIFCGKKGRPDISRSRLSWIAHKKIIGVSWRKKNKGSHNWLGKTIYDY